MSKRALVTGAGGFIGSHLVEMLLDAGWQVRALVRYNSRGFRGWLETFADRPGLEIIFGDVRNGYQMDNAVAGMDTVFHLAALIGIPYSYEAPEAYVQTNVVGTLNLLQAARRHGTARFVHTSTSETYGTALYTPIDETHPLQGQSPYSASKIGADKLVESFHLSFELPTVTVRPFNTYGPRQSARAVIPTIITQALAGPTVKLGSLDPVRDLTYVTDTAAGFLAAAEAGNAALGQTVNLGTGSAVPIGELAHIILDLLGGDHELVSDEQRVRPAGSEVMTLLSDNSRAADLLGWRPAVDLRTGLERTITWLRDHQHLYRPDEYTR